MERKNQGMEGAGGGVKGEEDEANNVKQRWSFQLSRTTLNQRRVESEMLVPTGKAQLTHCLITQKLCNGTYLACFVS